MRRPVTSFTRLSAYGYVICDDGAVFRYDDPGWEEMSPIPGSPRAEEVEHPAPKLLGPARREHAATGGVRGVTPGI